MIMPQFYQWKCPDPIFRQGRRARVKNLVSGTTTRHTQAPHHKTAWGTTSLKTSSCACFLTKQDIVELLEKRVKSRFSHRQINLFCDYSFEDYVEAFKSFLSLPADFSDGEYRQKWERQIEVWNHICALCNTHIAFCLLTSCCLGVRLSLSLHLCVFSLHHCICESLPHSVCVLVCCFPMQELSLNAKVRAALRRQYDTHPDIGSLKSFLVSAIQYHRSEKFRCKNIFVVCKNEISLLLAHFVHTVLAQLAASSVWLDANGWQLSQCLIDHPSYRHCTYLQCSSVLCRMWVVRQQLRGSHECSKLFVLHISWLV